MKARAAVSSVLALITLAAISPAPIVLSSTQQNNATQTNAPANDVVLKSLQAELNRSFAKLKNAGDAPLYFIGYRVYDVDDYEISGEFGALKTDKPVTHTRTLDVELRVGSPHLDNTHGEGRFALGGFDFLGEHQTLPLDDDEAAIRTTLWERTDSAFKTAQSTFAGQMAERDVKIGDEDKSDDFSVEKPTVFTGAPAQLDIDVPAWQARIRRLSAIYRNYPELKDSSVHFSAKKTRRYLVTSEGAAIEDDTIDYRIFTTAEAAADDGMKVWLYDGIEARNKEEVPSEAKLEEMVKKLAKSLCQLRVAKPAEPFAGPAILQSKSAGVFFHEIFGHRIEGHRQKDESEGRTFTKLIDHKVMPAFISVVDDPLLEKLGTKSLNGYYKYDDEGVPAKKVQLVDKGILKNFLMGRSPIKGFANSNGHGRAQPGKQPVARQGNLIVSSSKTVPYSELRNLLIQEVKRQKKPYGLIFDELAGGFTMTQTFMPQVFALKPLRVWRVFPDGRPDELLRGVDLVGTPLASLESILCAADDPDVFNGECGAESGYVPVSACSPSLLVQTIEVERNSKDQDKPPILPPPDRDPGKSDSGKGSKSKGARAND